MNEIALTLTKLFDPKEPEEKCGVILDDKTVIPVKNMHTNPESGFIIDAQELVRYEDRLWGTWHTHPATGANLSQEDYFGFLQWPNLHHFVIGLDGTRCFVVEDGLVIEKAVD